ncbi:O-antigen ligase domain-containing protein [Clostridium sp. WB02_MRS01]|uniref:O-antigen ligase family protein n=1 Tax=Clostridium sp. WB02_MRS01 TaxID=2605777 RepID=UPI0012B2880F|nr:O-antigen ligase family protein [Clostridium sp. WB02_MRS01]MSS10809.1 O-antigen ligase domain-containing protein [Clostridium sp. WB02_MRS01]
MERLDGKARFLSVVISIYVLLIGVGLPIVVLNGYFDILVVKYYFYCICTILMAILMVGYFITVRVKQRPFSINGFFLKGFFKSCTIADYAVLIYLMVATISTITSDYVYESFWGNEGRFTGLFLITWYVVSYFCVSRFWKFKGWYIDIILAAGMLVCLFGITDYFKLDIFHFKIAMLPEQLPMFTSTIGNINTYTAYVGILTAVSTVLFSTDKNLRNMLWHYLCMVISFFAIIMGVSDNAYLSLGALFGFLPLYLFKNNKGIQKYVIVLATFFSVIQCIDWINGNFGDRVLGIESVFDVLIRFQGLPFLVIGLWGIVVLLYFISYKKKHEVNNFGNLFRHLWMILLFLTILAILYALYDCNVAGNVNRYGSLGSYLLFNDDWGSARGYIWRKAMECFHGLPFWKKIVGFGPETFGILVMKKTANNPYNQLFDSAHNEYLHMLTTVGLAGLSAYLVFIFEAVRRCLHYKNKSPYIMALMFGIICYSIQALVNLNLPIVTPIFWLLIGLGGARSTEEKL